MAIEFDCQGCGQRLSTPDGSSGRQCQCPDCGLFVTIPAAATTVRSALNSSTQAPAAQSGTRATSTAIAPESLRIPCPRCRFDLICAPSLLGTKGQCRNCQHIFTIANNSTPQPQSAEAETPELIFRCPACKQLFAGQAELEGRKGKCHACGEVFAIALEPAPKADSQSLAKGQLRPVSSIPPTTPAAASAPSSTAREPRVFNSLTNGQPAPAQQTGNVVNSAAPNVAPIQFNCRNCSGVMEVPASTSGQQTMCPYCGETLTIPVPSAASSGVLNSAASVSERTFAPLPTSAAPSSKNTTNLWTELGDASGAAHANPYAAPSTQLFNESSAPSWSTPIRRKRPRGLTFSNAFELTFDSLYPSCLLAPLLFGMVVVVASSIYFIGQAIARQVIMSLELSDMTTRLVIAYGMLGCVMLVSVLIACAAYCMTCNTALHAVRGKAVSSRVVFNVGDAYGGMLAIMLGWTFFNVLRKIGLPYLVQEIARTNGLQTAAMVGVSVAIVFLLIQLVGTFLLSFVPFALLDGQSLSEAIGTSVSICLSRIAIVLPVLICGWLLYILVGIVSIGLGLIVLFGALFYLNAAIYHLAES